MTHLNRLSPIWVQVEKLEIELFKKNWTKFEALNLKNIEII